VDVQWYVKPMSYKNNLLDWFASLPPLWGPATWIGLQICAISNHRKKIKADPTPDSPKAFTVNRELSIVDIRRVIFWNWCRLLNAHCTPL